MGCASSAETQPERASQQQQQQKNRGDSAADEKNQQQQPSESPTPQETQEPAQQQPQQQKSAKDGTSAPATGGGKGAETRNVGDAGTVAPQRPGVITSLTGTAFVAAAGSTAAPQDADEVVDRAISFAAWTSNERYFVAADASGAITCWAAFVPYKKLWSVRLPREPKRMSPPAPVAVLAPHQCDVTGILAVDSHGHLWRLDTATGHPTHLACVLPDGVKPSPAAVVRTACLVTLAPTANPNSSVPGKVVNVIVLCGMAKGVVTGFTISFTPMPEEAGSPKSASASGTTATPAPAYRVLRVLTSEAASSRTAEVIALSVASESLSTVMSLEANARRAAVGVGSEQATPETAPFLVAVGDSDGGVTLLRHRGLVALSGQDAAEVFTGSTAVFRPPGLKVHGGLTTLHAMALSRGDGALTVADIERVNVALVTVDGDGTIGVWYVPQTGGASAAAQSPANPPTDDAAPQWPVAQRRIGATCAGVALDRRYLLCGVTQLPDDVAAMMGIVGGKGAARGNDVVAFDLRAALQALPLEFGAPPPKDVRLEATAPLRLSEVFKEYPETDAPRAAVTAVSQSTNRLMLLVCTAGGAAAMVDFSNFVKPDRLSHHRGNTVASVAIVANGKFAVSACEDTTMRAWELLSGRPLCTMDAHVGRVWSVAAVKGVQIGSGARPSMRTTKIAADGTPVAAASPVGRRAGGAAAAATNAAASWIVSGAEDGTMRVWSLPTGRLVETHVVDESCVWSVTSEGGFLAAGGADGAITVFCLADELKSRMLRFAAAAEQTEGGSKAAGGEDPAGAVELPAAASFARFTGSNGGPKRAGAGGRGRGAGGPNHSQTPAEPEKRFVAAARLTGHTGAVSSMASVLYAPTSSITGSAENVTIIISASFDTTVRVWDVAAEACLHVVSGHSDIVWGLTTNAAFHPRCGLHATALAAAAASPARPAPNESPGSEPVDSAKPASPAEAPPPLMLYTASEDKTVRAVALSVDGCLVKAEAAAEARSAGFGAAAPTPTANSVEVAELAAVLDVDAPAACVAMLGPAHIAVGTGQGDLLVAELGAPVVANARKGAYTAATHVLRPLLELPGMHGPGTSLCAIASSKHCLLTGGVDGLVRYHEPWPALQELHRKSDEERAAALRETRRARLVMMHDVTQP